jgi:hypothetical protein
VALRSQNCCTCRRQPHVTFCSNTTEDLKNATTADTITLSMADLGTEVAKSQIDTWIDQNETTNIAL